MAPLYRCRFYGAVLAVSVGAFSGNKVPQHRHVPLRVGEYTATPATKPVTVYHGYHRHTLLRLTPLPRTAGTGTIIHAHLRRTPSRHPTPDTKPEPEYTRHALYWYRCHTDLIHTSSEAFRDLQRHSWVTVPFRAIQSTSESSEDPNPS